MTISVVSLCFIGCASNTQKAEKLIQEDLYKTLFDYESYEPIETTISEAHACFIYDSAVYTIGDEIAFLKESIDILREGANENAEQFQYLSGYRLENAKEKQYMLLDTCYYMCMSWYGYIDTLRQLCSNIDTTSVIGWCVNHKFRCKSKDGTPNIVDKTYIVDNHFKKILYKRTEGYYHDDLIISLVNDIVEHDNPPICTAYKLCYSFLSFNIDEYGSFENLLQSARMDQDVYREYNKLMGR